MNKPAGGGGKTDGTDEFYTQNLKGGLEAIEMGADPKKVFSRLQKDYPKKSKEMRTILDTARMSPELKTKVKEAVDRINKGTSKKTDEYRVLAAEYPEDQEILRKIIITPPDEDMFGALMEIFAN